MKPGFLLLVCLAMLTSACRVIDELPVCRLVKFVHENPINRSIHYDYITLKDGRIEKLFSFDMDINHDTLNKIIAYFEYNENGKVKAVRDESNPQLLIRFDGDFDSRGNVAKIRQTINGSKEDEISIEYDSKNRPVNIESHNLFGINRSIEYNAVGNPYHVFRTDLNRTPTVTEHIFDTKRNFFSGIPEIQFYWIIRPLSLFLPFGNNNIVSSKVYVYQGNELEEVESQRTRRELAYNGKGFPDIIRIIRNDPPNTVAGISSFSYDCE